MASCSEQFISKVKVSDSVQNNSLTGLQTRQYALAPSPWIFYLGAAALKFSIDICHFNDRAIHVVPNTITHQNRILPSKDTENWNVLELTKNNEDVQTNFSVILLV